MLMYNRLFSKFMAEYAAAQTGDQGSNDDKPSSPRSPHVDFDELELEKGLAASKAESQKLMFVNRLPCFNIAQPSSLLCRKSNRAGPSRLNTSSPPWDLRHEGLDGSLSSAGQGERSRRCVSPPVLFLSLNEGSDRSRGI
jgi:hypothetical protein